MRQSEGLGPRSESLDPGGRACASWGERSSSRVVSLLSVGGGGSSPAFRGRRPWTKERSLAVAMGGWDALTNRLCCGRGPEAPVKGPLDED